MNSEQTANEYMQRQTLERAKWAQVLARPTTARATRVAAKRSTLARLLGL